MALALGIAGESRARCCEAISLRVSRDLRICFNISLVSLAVCSVRSEALSARYDKQYSQICRVNVARPKIAAKMSATRASAN